METTIRDNNNQTTFFSFNGPNPQRGILFKHYELIALAFLAKQTLLTSRQFKNILLVFNPNATEKGLNKRVKKLETANIIGIRKASSHVKNDLNKLFIQSYGYKVLTKLGCLPSDWSNRNSKKSRNLRNLDHFLSIQEIVVAAFIASLRYGKSITPFNPTYYNKLDISSLMPDRVIQLEDKVYLNIEVDGGSESLSVILNKLNSYVELARSETSKKFVVLIATIDRSIPLRNQSSYVGKRRINNIKKLLSSNFELYDTSNLEIYTMSVTQAKAWVTFLVEKGNNFIDIWKDNAYEAVTGVLNFNKDIIPYEILHRDSVSLYPQHLPESIKSSPYYSLRSKGLHEHKTMIMLSVVPGSIRDMNRIIYLSELIEKNALHEYVDRLLIIYPKETDLLEDVIGYPLSDRIYFTAYDMLMDADITKHTFVYQNTTIFSKERTCFDG